MEPDDREIVERQKRAREIEDGVNNDWSEWGWNAFTVVVVILGILYFIKELFG